MRIEILKCDEILSRAQLANYSQYSRRPTTNPLLRVIDHGFHSIKCSRRHTAFGLVSASHPLPASYFIVVFRLSNLHSLSITSKMKHNGSPVTALTINSSECVTLNHMSNAITWNEMVEIETAANRKCVGNKGPFFNRERECVSLEWFQMVKRWIR